MPFSMDKGFFGSRNRPRFTGLSTGSQCRADSRFAYSNSGSSDRSRFRFTEVYATLEKNFYNKTLDSPALLNASLDGLAKWLEAGPKVKFSPEKIIPGTDAKVSQAIFKAEFGKAEVAARAVKFDERHTLAFVASSALLYAVGDSHTGFMDPKAWEYFQRENFGKTLFAGIGALVRRTEDGLFYLSEVYPDTPADKAGLERFDRILAVDGISVPAELDYAVSMLRGDKCTEVNIAVLRKGKKLDFKVERNDITLPVAREGIIAIDGKRFSYLHLYSFSTPAAFHRTLEHVVNMAMDKGVAGHIIDLRDNPGGRLDVLDAIFEIFLVSNRQCYFVQDEKGRYMHTTSRGQVDNLPVVVLVNEGSGSASEVFAAVMMEQGRAVTIGARTAGAVSVANQFELSYGSGMMVAIR